MRTVVQLGLWQSAELVFLANKDVEPVLLDYTHVDFTDEELESDWIYYGIDCDVSSIERVANKYPRHSHVHWVCAQVVPRGVGVSDGTVGWPSADSVPVLVLGVSLSHFFEEMGIDSVDVLAMDIEGAEYPLFEGYEWHLKPDRILVEMHRLPGGVGGEVDRLNKAILPQGYRLCQHVLLHGQTILDWANMHVEYRRHV